MKLKGYIELTQVCTDPLNGDTTLFSTLFAINQIVFFKDHRIVYNNGALKVLESAEEIAERIAEDRQG